MRRGFPFAWAAVLAVSTALSLVLRAWLATTLYDTSFLSGWVLFAALGGLALAWWFARPMAPALPRRVRRHLLASGILILCFALHLDGGLSGGWLETLLLALFLGLLASTVTGAAIVAGDGAGPESPAVKRWLACHVALLHSLLGAALFHGVFVHGHGLLAHVALYGGSG